MSRATTLLNLSYHKVFLIIPFSFILSSVLIPIITNEKTGMKNHARNHNIFVYQKPIPLREGDHRIYRNLNFVKSIPFFPGTGASLARHL